MGMTAMAQQNLSWGQGPQVASPDVHADNSVTFNLIAPEAQKVQITGDFLPPKTVEFGGNTYDMPGVVDLVKDDKGAGAARREHGPQGRRLLCAGRRFGQRQVHDSEPSDGVLSGLHG